MKKRLLIGLLFPLLAGAMENGLTIEVIGKQLNIINILHDEQKKPTEKMDAVHEKLALYLQQRKETGCNMYCHNGFAALLNDAACEQLVRENKATDLRDYWSDGKKYKQSVKMKVYNN